MRLRARCGPWHKRLSVLASRIHRSWKMKLQRVVLRAVADVALLAMNGCWPEGGSAELG